MEDGGYWIESTWKDADGALYAWYHNEPDGICLESNLTAPRIGAAVSYDNGRTFKDLGFIIETRDTINCDAQMVMMPRQRRFFGIAGFHKAVLYFFFQRLWRRYFRTGSRRPRMGFNDRKDPVNKVWKWHDGGWNEPG